MPKKTKRQKIIAEARRTIAQAKSSSSYQSSMPTTTEPVRSSDLPYQFTRVQQTHGAKEPKMMTQGIEFTSIRRDLYKTVMISAAALFVEYLIYTRV